MTIPPRATPEGPTISFDIGGTHLRAAVVTADGAVIDRVQKSSNGTAEALEDGIVEMTAELLVDHPDAVAVGLAVAGFLDSERRVVRFAPHLPWRDADVAARLGERLPIPVSLEHDANSAAWGEYRFGAARGARDWVLFALGTGIGGAMMSGGKIFRGAHGTAPEFGHLTVVPGGRLCACGRRGCLERYASGTALADTAVEHGLPPGMGGPELMAAARAGDARAQAVIGDFAAWLGQGLSTVVDVLDPELIILGGGVAVDTDLFLADAQAAMAANIVGAGHRPLPVVGTAELGPAAGMIGVADLARTHY